MPPIDPKIGEVWDHCIAKHPTNTEFAASQYSPRYGRIILGDRIVKDAVKSDIRILGAILRGVCDLGETRRLRATLDPRGVVLYPPVPVIVFMGAELQNKFSMNNLHHPHWKLLLTQISITVLIF